MMYATYTQVVQKNNIMYVCVVCCMFVCACETERERKREKGREREREGEEGKDANDKTNGTKY